VFDYKKNRSDAPLIKALTMLYLRARAVQKFNLSANWTKRGLTDVDEI
jgi:hypothetical protein